MTAAERIAQLERALETQAIRFELLAGRFRACASHEASNTHDLSIWECEGFAADCRALASDTSRIATTDSNGEAQP